MTAAAVQAPLSGWGRAGLVSRFQKWRGWTARNRTLVTAVALGAAAVLAYHFTLLSLFDYLRLDTPLAYLPLLPLFTAWTVYARVQQQRFTAAPIRDRQVDFLVGVPLVVVSITLVTAVPAVWSTYYWSDRPDVVSMALFVCAGVIMFFGFNWFWRLRGPLLFLLLMWPSLYLHLMPGMMAAFTDATNGALAAAVQHLPLAVKPGGGPGLLSVTVPHAAPLLVSVGTACSGANSVLGFLLIGGAILMGLKGRRTARLAWLVTGIALTFALNLLRLVSILALAAAGQPGFALGAYHAVIGLVLFGIAIGTMSALVGVFGLGRPRSAVAGPVPAEPATKRIATGSWARLRLPLMAFVAATLVLTFADHDLRAYASFADGSGAPTVGVFGGLPVSANGPRVVKVQTYPWATEYFGAHSDFSRWALVRPRQNVAWVDVVRTDDKGSLDAYNLQNCFLFHNYDIRTSRQIDLGNGVTGLLLNYSDSQTNSRWATVSWAWPVRYKGDTYFERIAMTSALVPGAATAPDFRPGDNLRATVLAAWNGLGSSKFNAAPEKIYVGTDTALQADAARLVDSTLKRSGG